MAITNFIPEIWNAQMQLDFTEATIAAGLVNREYEGDLRSGNTVHITTATPVSVKDYKAGYDAGSGAVPRTTHPDAVSSTQLDLVVDQEKSFDFLVDDIDRAQVAGSLEAFTQSAGTALAEDADKFILATAVTGADSGNVNAAGTKLTDANGALNVLRDLRKSLNKQHVPQGNRVAIVNAEFEAMLLSAGGTLMQVNTSGSPAGLRDAAVARLLGFDIYTSENLPTTAKQSVLAFYRPAVAYVSQIQGTEAMRAQDSFSDRLRGLHVYGGKVIRAKAVAVWTSAT